MFQNSLVFLLLDADGKDLRLLEAISLLHASKQGAESSIKERWEEKRVVLRSVL